MSALTGRHPYENEVWTNEHVLNSGIPTLAHALGAAGYRPVLIGRMHAIGSDQLHGYAERYIGDHSSNHPGGKPVDRGVLSGTAGPDRISLTHSGEGQSAYQVHDEFVTSETVAFVNRLGVAKRSDQPSEPFCLTIGFMLPHPPYVARPEDFEYYRERVLPPKKDVPFSDVSHPHLRWWRSHTRIESVELTEIHRARAAYWALVHRMDVMIGEILGALEKNNLLRNTLIVYTSDHGDMLGEHGLWWKHVFFEESVRIPAIFSWPEQILAGRRYSEIVSSLDINATILDALGAPELPNSHGRSLMPVFEERKQTSSWEAYSEYCSDEYAPEGGCFQRMLRRGEWKLIYYFGRRPQLFNLAEDPGETMDRCQDPACVGILREMTEQVLTGWNPEMIQQRMNELRADRQVFTRWARGVDPPEQYRWVLIPEMNRLKR